MKKIIIILFYIPVVFNIVNAQAFLAKFTPASYAQVQLFAYFNFFAIILGGFLLLRRKRPFFKSTNLWIFFYILYFVLAMLGNIYYGTDPNRPVTLIIPVVYFVGFSILISIPGELKPLIKVLTIAFFLSGVLSILFNYFHIDMDYGGLQQGEINRAGGVYGDANNSALAAIISFLLIYYTFAPKSKLQKAARLAGLIISLIAIIITFSKTGFLVLLFVLFLIYRRKLTFKRLVFTFLLTPILLYLVGNWVISRNLINADQEERIFDIVNLLTLQTGKVNYSSRDVLLANMFRYIEENPFMGHGIQFANGIRGHNTVIGIWADTGIIGFLVFLGIWVYYFRRSFNLPGILTPFTLSILVSFFVFMITLQTIINQDYLMVVLALTTFLLHYHKKDYEQLQLGQA